MGFANSVVGGITLVRPAIRSPNFVTGTSGWTINIDGSAEFNNVIVRGDLQVGGVPPAPSIEIAPAANIPAALQTFYTGLGEPLIAAQLYWKSATNYSYMALSSAGTGLVVMGNVNGAAIIEDFRWSAASAALIGAASGAAAGLHIGLAGAGQTVDFLSGVLVQILSGATLQIDPGAGLTIDGVSSPRSSAGNAILTASSANVTAETVVNSFVMDFKAGRAYSIRFGGRVDTSDANGRPRMRLHKTNVAGTLWGDFGGWTTNATVGEDQAVASETVLRRTAGTDLTAVTLALTLEHLAGGANTARLVASATNPFWFGAFDIGAAADFPNAVAVT